MNEVEAVGKKRTRLNGSVSLVTMVMMEVALLPLSVSDSELIGSWELAWLAGTKKG